MSETPKTQSGKNADSIFSEYIARVQRGELADFEEVCRAHPADVRELRSLLEQFERMQSLLRLAREKNRPTESFAARLKDQYGLDVDPAISLDARAAVEQPASAPTDALVKRLREHALPQSRYKLEGEIARGGMGAILKIWDEDLRRHLAMKVILGKSSPEKISDTPAIDAKTLGRFLEEAQVTGQLDHPGIVPVHELGLDNDGRVYFTMKLVKGRDLKQIFDLVFEEKEGWNETRALGVILKACEAMAYAHIKGVIHRDLKPANVMVGNFGEVYVMDWGLARVIGRKDTHDMRLKPMAKLATSSLQTERREEREGTPDSPLVTMDGDIMGTPFYMSPEQARGEVEKLGARSDVYSVGAMLYHLLTRQMPYAPAGAKVNNRMVLLWLLEGAPKPILGLRRDVPAELVAICEKAMARDASKRYADTVALADDLRAYLEHRVVGAYETGALAEAKKWVARNKPLAASLAAAVALLIGGLMTALAFKERADENATLAETRRIESDQNATRARENEASANDQRDLAVLAKDGETKQLRIAEAQRDKANKIADFMADTLKGAGPSKARGRDITMLREMMDDAAERIESGELKDAPEAELRLRGTIGTTYRELSLYPDARKMIDPALVLARGLYPGDSDALGRAISNRAVLLLAADKGEEGEPLAREALAMLERLHPGDHDLVSTATNNVGEAVRLRGDWKGAEQYFRRAFEMKRRLDPSDNWGTAKDLDNLAKVLVTLDKDDAEAETLMKQSLDMRRRLFKGDHPEIATGINNMGYVLDRRGDYEGAERMIREALDMIQRLHPGDHADVAVNLYNLARAVERNRDPEGAEKIYREAMAMNRRLFSGDHPTTASALARLLFVLQSLGQWEESMQVGLEAVEMLRRLYPGGNVELVQAVGDLGVACWRNRRLDLSVPLFEESLRGKEATLGRKNSIVQNSVANLGINYKDAGRFADAIPLLEEAYQASKEDPDLEWVVPALCEAYIGASPSLGPSMTAKAVALTREAVAQARAKYPAGSNQLASELATNALTFLLCEEWTEAEVVLRDCLSIREAKQPNAWRTFNTKSSLGGALLGQKKYAEAEPLLVAGYEGLKARESEVDKTRLQQALERLVQLAEAQGDEQKAAEWKEKLEAARQTLIKR